MKTQKRRLAALALALGLTCGRAASAADKDSLTVTITPIAAYGVLVTTTNVGLDLGSVALNASTQTVKPSTITVTSSWATTNLTLTGIMGGTGTPWTFSPNTAVAGNNQLQTWAVFTDTSSSVMPAQGAGYFSGTVPAAAGSGVVDASARAIGGASGTGLFVNSASAAAPYKAMTNLPSNAVDPAAATAHLWLYFKLPASTTDLNAKLVTFLLTAGL